MLQLRCQVTESSILLDGGNLNNNGTTEYLITEMENKLSEDLYEKGKLELAVNLN